MRLKEDDYIENFIIIFKFYFKKYNILYEDDLFDKVKEKFTLKDVELFFYQNFPIKNTLRYFAERALDDENCKPEDRATLDDKMLETMLINGEDGKTNLAWIKKEL